MSATRKKKKRLRIPAVNHVLHRDNPHNVKYKQYILIMWKTQWKDCMQKATWSEQEAGSKYIPSHKAHIWDNKSKISLHLTVLSHSDITQAACPLYESVWTPDSSAHLQISSFSSGAGYKTYQITYRALKRGHHQTYNCYQAWQSRHKCHSTVW